MSLRTYVILQILVVAIFYTIAGIKTSEVVCDNPEWQSGYYLRQTTCQQYATFGLFQMFKSDVTVTLLD